MLNDKPQRLRTTQFPAEFLHDTNVNSFFSFTFVSNTEKKTQFQNFKENSDL